MSAQSIDDLDLGAIRLFLGAIELGSVSKAAARAGLTQPSATARLQKIERRLGLALLERGPTGSSATEAGAVLAPLCRELLAVATRLTGEAHDLVGTDEQLRLAATRTAIDHALPRWLADADLTDLTINCREFDTFGVCRAVREGQVALGLCDGPAPPLGLRSLVVDSIDLAVVVAPHHRLAGAARAKVTARQLVAADLVLRARGSGTRDVVEMAIASHEVGVIGRRIEVASNGAARLAAVNGTGVAILPDELVAPDLAAGRLRRLRPVELEFRQPIRLVWKGTRPATDRARRLHRRLSSIAAEPASP